MSAAGIPPNPAGDSRFQIFPSFAVPMAVAHLPQPESLNDELRNLFLKREKEGQRYANPDPIVQRNKALFESNFELFNWPEACVQKLREFSLTNLYRTIGSLNNYDAETLKKLHLSVQSWYHITRRGGYFGAHNHAMNAWSGVYCVKHDGDDPESDSGKLTFIHPNSTASMYTDMSLFKMQSPFAMGPIRLRLVPGQLVLFPSWLLHEVMPYEGQSERITVAFNVRFRYADMKDGMLGV